jgi:HK97 family phage prohead protease
MSMEFLGSVEQLGERECGVIVATSQLARDGHVLEPKGISLTNFRKVPIVLWQHDIDKPVGAATAVGIENGALAARIDFAPAGASGTADEICALVKAGVVRGISIGFDPIDMEPLDPKRGSRGGMHILTSELLEISFCAVPVDTGATVIARSFKSKRGAAAILRALPRISSRAVERALASVVRTPRVPYAFLSPAEKFEIDRQRCMTVWGLQVSERERETRYSYEQRQADLRLLSNARMH